MRLAILTVLLTTSTMLLAQTTPSIPPFDQVANIRLYTTNGWYLSISPDGSGGLGYGSSGGDGADFQKQTFSFKEIYDLLVPHLSKEGNIQQDTAVAFHVVGFPTSGAIALYLNDKSIVKKIMSQAINKSVPFEPKRFNELLAKYPPVPPDEIK